MNRTKIPWAKNPDGTQGYTSNPMKGYCPMACPYCYARRLYDRFGWDKTIRMDKKEIDAILNRKKPTGIFVGSMFELFLNRYEPWMQYIMFQLEKCPQHRIYLLTKQPQNLIKFSPFPENCWVGVTATTHEMFAAGGMLLGDIKASVKYISMEPLLSWGDYPAYPDVIEQWAKGLKLYGINWVIIGAQTSPKKMPAWDWVKEIIEACDKAGVAVFLKNNLGLPRLNFEGTYPFYKRITSGTRELRQEMPV